MARLAEFEALAGLHARATPEQQTAVLAELGRFIEVHALREGVPGAQARVASARRHLSEPAAELLEARRGWRYDSDPAVAGTRMLLTET